MFKIIKFNLESIILAQQNSFRIATFNITVGLF